MGLFWNNGKKVRKDAKNLFSDNRYRKNKLFGETQLEKLVADFFNTLSSAKKK